MLKPLSGRGNNDLQKTAVGQRIKKNKIKNYLWCTEHLKALMVELLWLKYCSNSLLWQIDLLSQAGLFRDARITWNDQIEPSVFPGDWPPSTHNFLNTKKLFHQCPLCFKSHTRLFEYFKARWHLKDFSFLKKQLWKRSVSENESTSLDLKGKPWFIKPIKLQGKHTLLTNLLNIVTIS